MSKNKVELYDLIGDKALSFSRYVITDRAIPSLTDGLKLIQRRILYSMYVNGTRYNKYRVKNTNISGATMNYSPHGNTSIEEAIKRLGNDSVVYKLIDGQGAYGTVLSSEEDGGSARYLEARASKFSENLYNGLSDNAVLFKPTYDEKRTEPVVLPSSIPLILANAQSGIAVGIATNIPSFDLKDIRDNVECILTNKPTNFMFPTFATGGYVLRDNDVAQSVKDTGRGKYTLRAKYHIEGNDIKITELPYGSTSESVIAKILKLVDTKKTNDITYINDDSGADGFCLTITCKKNVNKDELMQFLYQKTPLENTFSCNMNVLDINNTPKLYGTDEILRQWIKFRAKTIKNIENENLKNKSTQLNILIGMREAIKEIDDIIDVIRASQSDKKIVENLIKLGYNEEQAQHISEMKLRNLSEEFFSKKIKEISKLEKEIADIEKLLSSKKMIAKRILNDIDKVIEEHYIPRQTMILDEFKEYKATTVVEEEDYNVKLFVTNEGYVKVVPLTSLRGNGEFKLKEEDFIIQELDATKQTGEFLVFTNKQNCYKLYASMLDNSKLSDFGQFAKSLVDLEKDEDIIYVMAKSEVEQTLLFGFENGKVLKVSTTEYDTKTKRGRIANAYSDKSPIIYIGLCVSDYIMATSSENKHITLDISKMIPKGRKSHGSNIQKLKNNQKTINYTQEIEDIDKYLHKTAGYGKK